MERFGVPPSKVIEVQALIGDPTDNVPGVPGIGVKTAALLINEYGDLDTLLARASEITQPKRRESLDHFRRPGAAVADAGDPRYARAAGRAARRDSGPPARGRDAAELPAQARILAPCSAASPTVSASRRPPVPHLRRQHSGRRRTTTTTRSGAHRAEASSPSGPSRSIRRRKARLCISPKSARPSSPRFPSTAANTRRWSILSASPRCSTKRAIRAMSPFAPRSHPPIRCKGSLSAWRLRFAPDRRPTFRSPTVQPMSSISAAKRARGSRCARRSIC